MQKPDLVYNSEQEVAIFHEGSVLLDAGAGAGKTFVIVEHLIYLFRKIIKSYRVDPKLDFDFLVSDKLSSIVVMTFTIKATREISVRIKKRIHKEVEVANTDKNLWQIIENNIASLKINTIHGICLTVLKEFGHYNFKIESQLVLNDKVNRLIDQWYVERPDYVDKFSYLNYAIIKSIVTTIFNDPDLRTNFSKVSTKPVTFDLILKRLIKILNFKYLFSTIPNLDNYSSFQKTKWYQLILEFQKTQDPFTFCLNISRLPPVSKTDSELSEIVSFFEEFKIFRDHCRNLNEIKINFDSTQKEYERLKSIVLSIYQYVEANYLVNDGISFSDLEYYALKLLNDKTILEKVVEKYSYFIVDEFQDTSQIQFSILKKLINNDFKKLFCVGDLKQAIYGFRGGEIDVFNECASLITHQYKLLNNYRSDFDIVNFNNAFFETVFQHKNINRELIQFTPQQTVQIESNIKDSVFKIIPKNSETIESTDIDLDEVEATLIFNYLREANLNNVAILYKVLSPSHHLIEKLFKSSLLSSIQIKIPLSEDWIVGIFKLLLTYKLAESKRAFHQFMLDKYLQLFNIKFSHDRLFELLEKFNKDVHYLSVFNAFLLFIKSLNISFSTFKSSFSQLENICLMAVNRIEKILKILESNLDFSSSYELELNGGKVIYLMTTHASKGLEFEHVLVAGIYSNFRGKYSSVYIGENLEAVTYKSEILKNETVKTPLKYLDELVEKLKDKSEADRLLYVACTRAKKSLGWVQLTFLQSEKLNQNAWAHHFWSWDIEQSFASKEIAVDLTLCNKESVSKVPILHIDNFTVIKANDQMDFLVLPELSVTKLATIVHCSRKFYLRNICKIAESDLANLNLMGQVTNLSDNGEITNSSDRGTHIHYLIENYIKFKKPLIDENLIYLKNEIDQYLDRNFELFSELTIKFKLFNYMITGIIDLLITNEKLNEILIIDFKTGIRKKENEELYWFQLTAYAYGLFELNKLKNSDKVKIQIIYLDEKQKVERVLSFMDAKNYLFSYWVKLNSFDRPNLNHCSNCEYNKICQI
ncbi:MAG: UvrD-helicase domain-containing protein [Bacteriovoracaceae bacterium]